MTALADESVGAAAAAAWACADTFRRTSPEQRASLLDAIASEIEALGDHLIDVLETATALPPARPRR